MAEWSDERSPSIPRSGPLAARRRRRTQYVSFAEWMCPINCIEPARCPHTRGARSWSIPIAVREYVDDERESERVLEPPLVFHCTHRAHGVGMIDVADVIDADAAIATTDGAVRRAF